MSRRTSDPTVKRDRALVVIRNRIQNFVSLHRRCSHDGQQGGLLWDDDGDGPGDIHRSPLHPNSPEYTRGVNAAIEDLGKLLAGRGTPRVRAFNELWRFVEDYAPEHKDPNSHGARRYLVDVLSLLNRYLNDMIGDGDRQSEDLLQASVNLQKASLVEAILSRQSKARVDEIVPAVSRLIASHERRVVNLLHEKSNDGKSKKSQVEFQLTAGRLALNPSTRRLKIDSNVYPDVLTSSQSKLFEELMKRYVVGDTEPRTCDVLQAAKIPQRTGHTRVSDLFQSRNGLWKVVVHHPRRGVIALIT